MGYSKCVDLGQSQHDKIIHRICKRGEINLIYEIDYSANGLIQEKGSNFKNHGPRSITLRLASLRTPLNLLSKEKASK